MLLVSTTSGSEATSMSDVASVLFGLEDEFSVVVVERLDSASVRVLIEQSAREGSCPECGVLAGKVKDRPLMRLKDVPASGQRAEVWWRKRRLVCQEAL
jgi:transposase